MVVKDHRLLYQVTNTVATKKCHAEGGAKIVIKSGTHTLGYFEDFTATRLATFEAAVTESCCIGQSG